MILNKLREPKLPELDINVADQILQNTFEICNVEPNSVPLETLVSYARYRSERFSLQKLSVIVIMILFCMLPLFFIAPDFTLTEKSANEYNTSYELDIDTIMPVKSVDASINGQGMPVYDTGHNTYEIKPDANGDMVVTVTLINNQYVSEAVSIRNCDFTAPSIVSNNKKDGKIYFYLREDGCGIDYDTIYAIDIKGNKVLPSEYDEKKSCVVFNYPETSLNIYIADKAGNTLQLVLNK